MRLLLMLALSLSLAIQTSENSTSGVYSLVRVSTEGMTKQQYLDLAELGLDITEAEEAGIEIILKYGEMAKLQNIGLHFDIIQTDLKSFYSSRNTQALSMGGFRTFSEIEIYLDSLTSAHPTISTAKFSIGNSLQGRPLWAVKISDNPAVDEDEPELLYMSLIHSREPAAGAAVLNIMEHLLDNYGVDAEITDIVDNRELYFVPVQNPDGYVYNELTDPTGGGLWRKNRRSLGGGQFGIDLNRNYGYKWGFDNIGSSNSFSSETYRGSSGFSEPETQITRDFIISRNFTIIHNFHTYSNLELWPYGYDRVFTHEDDFFEILGDSLTQYNSYTPEIGWDLYPTNGGADDWAWGDTISKPRIISMTVEIGNSSDGFWPDPFRIPTLINENLWPNLFLAKIADNPYRLAPPEAPVAFSPDSSVGDFVINWSHADTDNPAVSYRLYELTDRQEIIDDAETDDGLWETANIGLSSARAFSGTKSWHSFNLNRKHHWLLSNTPYQVKTNDSLKFRVWYAIEEDWDYFYAQISTDGGYTFTNLANDMTTNINPNGLNLGNGITGFSTGWELAAFDLSAYEGQEVIVRLAYFTDNFSLEEGVYLDEIENVELFLSEITVDNSVVDTFYNFNSYSAGDYWYRVEAVDADNQVSRLSNLAYSRVYQVYEIGDLDNNGAIDIADLLFMVEHQFGNPPGPAPDPWYLEDVDCSGTVDIADLLYMVDYQFGTPPGPAPCQP